jgi:hypothetical protein
LPSGDYFSYTNYGKAWFSWEWLADVLLALIHKFGGLNGIAFWANATFALTFTLLFSWTAKRGGNVLVCLLFSRIAGFAAAVHWLARPHLFSMLLVLFWYMLLERIQKRVCAGRWQTRDTASRTFGRTAWCFVTGPLLLNFCGCRLNNRQARHAPCNSLELRFVCWLLKNPYFRAQLFFHCSEPLVEQFTSPNFHSFVVKS